MAPTPDARLRIWVASDGQHLYLLMEVDQNGRYGVDADAEIDFEGRLRVRIRPNGQTQGTTPAGTSIGNELRSVVTPTAEGYRTEITIERTLLRKLGLQGNTPVQTALLIPDNGFIRREQIVLTDRDPQTGLRIKL